MSNRSNWIESLSTIALSAVGGVLCYLLWMVIAIPTTQAGNDVLATLLWILSPVITALGFTTGAYIAQRRFRGYETSFFRIYLWPLVGCSVGAVSSYAFGPMLIVFGMLVLGTASIALREIWMIVGKGSSS